MASESLTKFTEVFNKQFDTQIAKTKERITKNEAKVKAHQEVHAQILKYLESNKLITKEAFLRIFPAKGGENIVLGGTSGILDPSYTTLVSGFRDEEDKDLKKLPDKIFGLANAYLRLESSKTQLQNEETIKANGPEKLVSLLYSAIFQETAGGVGVDKFLTKILGTKQNPVEYTEDSWEKSIYAISRNFWKLGYVAPEVLTDVSLFNLMQEKYFSGELGKKSETVASPINATEAEGEKAKSASPINQSVGESPDKKDTSASSITQTDQVKKPDLEPESKVESKTESINEPKPEPKPDGETAKKESTTALGNTPENKKEPATEGKASVEEKKATAGTINIGEKELAELDKREKEEKQKQAKISSVVENLKITDETKKSKVTDILTRFSESRGKELAETPKGSLNESFEKGKEIAQSIGKIGAPSTTVNQASTTTQSSAASTTIANFENVQATSTSQTINQTDQSKTSTSSAPVTKTSFKKTLTEAQQNIINDYKQKMGVLTPEEKKIRAELEQSIKIESGTSAPIKAGETVVEKGKTAFNEKVPASTQNTFASTQNTQNLNPTMSQPEKKTEVIKTEIASAPVQTGSASPTVPQPAALMDFSGLEKRLRNLEEILSSPLSVKVV